jgi:hypothetical protein
MLAYPNRIDEATLSGGAWGNRPLTCLQTRELSDQARSTDLELSSTKYLADLGRLRNISLLSQVNHNFSLDATYRITISATAGFETLLLDTGWKPAWPSIWSTYSLEFEDNNWWTGQPTEELKTGYMASLIEVLSTMVFARYILFEFNDPANPAGYLAIGRPFIGLGWQPESGVAYGSAVYYEENTKVDTSLGEVEYFDMRRGHRVTSFSLNDMSSDEAYNRSLELQRQAGISGEVFLVADKNDQPNLIRCSYLGRLRKSSPITHTDFKTYGTQYEVKEII